MTDTTNAANSSPITAECAANMPNEWAPKRIWLQRGVGEGGSHTWCEDSQEPEHEEASYIREDFAGTLSTDYLSGHQDGLDWAALVVEYTDPRTGDWMYDDPHDLAKAIRKGPDMSVYQSAPSAPQQGGDGLRRDQEAAYNSIDRFLRNNLCDEDYAQYSAELYSLLAAPRQPGEMGAGDDTQVVLRWIMSQAESAKEPCGDDPESAAAVRNAKLAAIANAAAQALGLVRGPSYADAEAQCNPNDICAGCRCKYSMAASAQQDEREAKPLTRFVTYLNEHCIGQTITEESLTDWMLDVMDNTPREEPKHPQKSKGLFASSAQQVQADAGAVAAGLLDALRFYANGSHFTMHDSSAWDTVSGEPPNFYEDESNTATVEDGSIAKLALQGKFFTDQEYQEPLVDGEVFNVAHPSPAGESGEPMEFQIQVAGPAGYVRFETFHGETLDDALECVRRQRFATVPDEDGFVTMKVKV